MVSKLCFDIPNDAKNPKLPRLNPRIGGTAVWNSPVVCKIVPSPPKQIIKSITRCNCLKFLILCTLSLGTFFIFSTEKASYGLLIVTTFLHLHRKQTYVNWVVSIVPKLLVPQTLESFSLQLKNWQYLSTLVLLLLNIAILQLKRVLVDDPNEVQSRFK